MMPTFHHSALCTLVLTVTVALSAGPNVAHAGIGRHDLQSLEKFLKLVAVLHPDIEPTAAVRATIGSLDDGVDTPKISIELIIPKSRGRVVEGVGVVVEPERHVYIGSARFNRYGQLESYRGTGAASGERHASLYKNMGPEGVTESKLRDALRDLRAPFAERAPTLATCRSLRVVSDAIGKPSRIRAAYRPQLSGSLNAEELTIVQLAWKIELEVRRSGTLRLFVIGVDPWGDVLSVLGEGSPP